jgi:hypothetical protein
MIAGDEMRHHHAYSEFVTQIFKVDPSEMLLAFNYMMKQKIVGKKINHMMILTLMIIMMKTTIVR